VWALLGGDGLRESVLDELSFECRYCLEELMLEGLFLFIISETWKDINICNY
jgi:hypothetical protein